MALQFNFKSKVWLYQGKGAWHFISVPVDTSKDIKEISSSNHRGFGSLRVIATIKDSSWNTSIFPDNKRNCYLLPLKKEIRKINKLAVNDNPEVTIDLLDF